MTPKSRQGIKWLKRNLTTSRVLELLLILLLASFAQIPGNQTIDVNSVHDPTHTSTPDWGGTVTTIPCLQEVTYETPFTEKILSEFERVCKTWYPTDSLYISNADETAFPVLTDISASIRTPTPISTPIPETTIFYNALPQTTIFPSIESSISPSSTPALSHTISQNEINKTKYAESSTKSTQTAESIAKTAVKNATETLIVANATQQADNQRQEEDRINLFLLVIFGGLILAAVIVLFRKYKQKHRTERYSGKSGKRQNYSKYLDHSYNNSQAWTIKPDLFEDTKTLEIDSSDMLLQYGFGNIQHQGRRNYQEDSFGFSDISDPDLVARRGILAVVADGMGGLQNGKSISERTITKFRTSFLKFSPYGNIPQQLRDLVIETNADIYKTDLQKGGTTLICAYFFQNSMYWISVGDSIIYVYRQGRIYQLNQEHNRLNVMYLKYMYQEINKEDLISSPSLQGLTSNIGRQELREIDQNLIEFKLKRGDRILLCTDGISGRLSEKEIILALSQGNPQRCANALKQMVLKKNAPKQDNFTAEVISCD